MPLRALTSRAGAFATTSVVLLTIACGGGTPQAPAESAAPAAPAPAASTTPVLTIIEPAPGFSSGHIDLFRWEPVDGATGYRVQVSAATDRRVVWDSPVIAETEAHLPNTIALEPESYFWQVTALKGDQVLVASAPSRFMVTP